MRRRQKIWRGKERTARWRDRFADLVTGDYVSEYEEMARSAQGDLLLCGASWSADAGGRRFGEQLDLPLSMAREATGDLGLIQGLRALPKRVADMMHSDEEIFTIRGFLTGFVLGTPGAVVILLFVRLFMN